MLGDAESRNPARALVNRRRRLLYATAVAPAGTGNGLAMRAGMILEALRETCQVWVAMPGRTPAPDPPFDIVHVFRLAAMAAAKPYLASARRRHLDLDDIESKTHKRIEALCRANGLVEAADREEAESRRCELLETAIFRSFDRVYVCSEADRDALAQRCPAELLILPNAVRLPASPPGRSPSEPYRFLFIGTMGYYPNFDACVWFCRKVAPILKRTAPEPFGVDIAGSGSAGVWEGHELLRFLGPVPQVGPIYEAAHAAIVPLRAGGGTRIKILEAFSYRRPVVSTTIGAKGITAAAGREILIGDSPEDFASRCVELMRDRDLADRLAENALRLVTQLYSAETVKRIVSSPPVAPVP
ncbi:MAG: glycosyltransferase [Bryobacteraceae bacterium]